MVKVEYMNVFNVCAHVHVHACMCVCVSCACVCFCMCLCAHTFMCVPYWFQTIFTRSTTKEGCELCLTCIYQVTEHIKRSHWLGLNGAVGNFFPSV